MRLFLSVILFASALLAQTSPYPGALDTDATQFVTADNIATTLSQAAAPGDVSLTVGSSAGFLANMVVTICDASNASNVCTAWEHMLVTGTTASTITVTRGYLSTVARSHAKGAMVASLIDAGHQKSLKSGLINIETALGVNLSKIAAIPILNSTLFNFAAQTPGGSLIIGSNVITMNPIPQGIAVGSSLYVSAGTGTAEPVAVTGWNSSTGQLIFTAANTHSGAWTIQSASAGIQEAEVVAAAAGGGVIFIPAGTYTMHATILVTASGIHITGVGLKTTILYRTEDYGDTFTVGSAAIGSITDDVISDLKLTYDMGGSPPTSIARHPTVFPNSAHVRVYGGINFHLLRCRVENMPYGFISDGGDGSSAEDCEFWGLWDYTNAGLQVTKASVYLTGDASPHGSTQVFTLRANQYFGNGVIRNVTINGVVKSINDQVGPLYMVQMDYVEVVQASDKLNGGGGAGYFLNPVTFGISGVTLGPGHCDGNRLAACLLIDNANSASGNVINVELVHLDAIGSEISASAVVVNSSAGIRPVNALTVNGGVYDGFFGSAFNFQDGVQISIAGINCRDYNAQNAYAASNQALGASCVTIGGNANFYAIGGGMVYGGGAHDQYAVTVTNSAVGATVHGTNAGLTPSGGFAEHAFNDEGGINVALSGYLQPTLGNSVASAGSITPTGMVFPVTGTATISTINLPAGFTQGCVTLIPDAIWATNTAGNIALASTAVVSKSMTMCYRPTNLKWYPSY